MNRPRTTPTFPPTAPFPTAVSEPHCTGDGYFNSHDRETIMIQETTSHVSATHPNIHIRKHPDDACAKPVWCGETYVASITEAWGYYGPGGDGHDDVCRGCIHAQRAAKRGAS